VGGERLGRGYWCSSYEEERMEAASLHGHHASISTECRPLNRTGERILCEARIICDFEHSSANWKAICFTAGGGGACGSGHIANESAGNGSSLIHGRMLPVSSPPLGPGEIRRLILKTRGGETSAADVLDCFCFLCYNTDKSILSPVVLGIYWTAGV